MKYLFLFLTVVSGVANASEFLELAARTASVFSTSTDVDASNPHEMGFETLLTNQRVFLNLSATHLNSTFYTIINSDLPSIKTSKSLVPPVININNLQILLDGSVNPSASCDGGNVVEEDTSCNSRNCNITQRVISSCNVSNCWSLNPSVDRSLTASLSEKFTLLSKVEITDCIPNNVSGEKHTLRMTVQNQAANILNGGTIQYALMLFNDVSTSSKR